MTTPRQSQTSAPGTARSLLLMGAVLLLVFVGVRAFRKLVFGVPVSQLPFHLAPWALLWLLALLVFVPGFLLAERAAISRGRVVPYTLVVLVGSFLVGALIFPLVDWLGLPAQALAPPDSLAPRQVTPFLAVLLRMGLAAFMYAFHRERLEEAWAVQALESRRNEMLGRLATSRLEAARARVQPEAFIAELRALRATYVEDPAAGGAGLEALIARLRAATVSAAP
jgi:hypothetical protein